MFPLTGKSIIQILYVRNQHGVDTRITALTETKNKTKERFTN